MGRPPFWPRSKVALFFLSAPGFGLELQDQVVAPVAAEGGEAVGRIVVGLAVCDVEAFADRDGLFGSAVSFAWVASRAKRCRSESPRLPMRMVSGSPPALSKATPTRVRCWCLLLKSVKVGRFAVWVALVVVMIASGVRGCFSGLRLRCGLPWACAYFSR